MYTASNLGPCPPLGCQSFRKTRNSEDGSGVKSDAGGGLSGIGAV